MTNDKTIPDPLRAVGRGDVRHGGPVTLAGASRLMALLGDDVAGPVGFAFDAMGIAEEALLERYQGDEPDGVFRACRVRYEIFQGRLRLVRMHMDEILTRFDNAEDLVPATNAEILAGLSDMSMAGPFRHDLFQVVVWAFVETMGEEEAVEVIGQRFVERAWEDYREDPRFMERLNELRHELRDPERGEL